MATIRAWYIKPFSSIKEEITFFQPVDGGEVTALTGSIESSRQIIRESVKESGIDLIETDGPQGIAITDPHWDGKPIFVCGNKKCKAVHDVH
jgi:hypothetical protein